MIVNSTTGQILSSSERYARTMVSQGRGLMFRTQQNLVMVFSKPQRISLHNFFVFFSLEIVILDSQKHVVEVKRQFNPWTLWNSSKKGAYCIEFGLEESKGKCSVGDKIEFFDA